MVSDYDSIKAENERKYGTDIGRIGPMLLANRYDDRTHFIFELLQNAEDALARRGNGWSGSRQVMFKLTGRTLRVSHFGAPLHRGGRARHPGCGRVPRKTSRPSAASASGSSLSMPSPTLRKSTRATSTLPSTRSCGPGRFQKSTPRPEETVFMLAFRQGDSSVDTEIGDGLQNLGPRSLLFLKQIKEISWSVEGHAPAASFHEPGQIYKNIHNFTIISYRHRR